MVEPIPGGPQPVTCGTSRARLTYRGQFVVIIGASCRTQRHRRLTEEVHIEPSEQPQQALSAYHSFTRDFPCAIAAKGASRPKTAGSALGEN
jgi:hypothetical protein